MNDHGKDIKYLAEHLQHTGVGGLANRELQALMRISRKLQSVRPEHALPDTGPTLGERLADRVAEFGGSWTFIMIFGSFLFCWAFINSELLGTKAFDPYPYIFLNLMLSMLAAIQAPIIMMSQNRQAARDRMTMIRDFEGMAADLARQIAAEEDRTGIKDVAHFNYSTFAKAASLRRDKLRASIEELKVQLEAAVRERDEVGSEVVEQVPQQRDLMRGRRRVERAAVAMAR